MISVIDWSTFELDNTRESIHMIDCGCSCDLCAETMSTDCCHRDFVFIHEPHDIVRHLFQTVRRMMIGSALVSIIEEPDISQVFDSAVSTIKERGEVRCWLDKLWKPDHRWQVWIASLKECSAKLDCICVLRARALYIRALVDEVCDLLAKVRKGVFIMVCHLLRADPCSILCNIVIQWLL